MTASEPFPSCSRACSAGVVLLLSVRSGDAAKTRALLRRLPSSDSSSDDRVPPLHPDATRDARGHTSLHLASIHDRSEITRLLIAAGASTESVVTSGANEGLTPLRLAAERGHLLTVRALLEAGADTAAEDVVDRATPLHAAASAGHTSVVVELIRRGGAKLEARAVSGQTPLRWALSMGHVGAAEALLEAGADPDAPDRRGACCLHTVAALKLEEDGSSAFAGTGEGSSLPGDMAQLLLSAGANPNLGRAAGRAGCVHPGRTPSSTALTFGSIHQRGSGDNSSSAGAHDGGVVWGGSGSESSACESPLHVAARESNVRVAELLLLHGADPNAKTPTREGGMSPLHCAASRPIVRMLLAAGADIGAVSADGLTSPLKLACLNAAVGCVKELLSWGADDLSCVPRSTPPSTLLLSSLPSISETTPPCPSSVPLSESSAVQRINVPRLRGLVGSRVPASVRDAADCEEIVRMLCQAPADRAWRRRGWLVMLYARATAAVAASSTLREQVPPQPQGVPSAKRKCVVGKKSAVAENETSEESGTVKIRDVVGRLFEAQGDQSVFRRVIEWL
ncbi:unnamed protein product [Ectocarpus sp. 12 AP-2014]